ncbi:MAG: ribosome maturation factor RimM [Gaiellaceae bacterium]
MNSEPDHLVPVGRVGRAHGLDGSFVVEQPSEEPDRFAVGASLQAGGEPVRVAAVKRSGGRLVIRLDRPVPRGTPLELPREALPPPAPDSYYVFQLLGLVVEEEGGRGLGRVREVEPGVANDVLELDSGLRLPLIEDCVRAIDLASGRIVVAPGFADPG